DFDVEKSFDLPHSYKDKPASQPQIKINPDYNPFNSKQPSAISPQLKAINKENWEKLYSEQRTVSSEQLQKDEHSQQIINPDWDNSTALLANKNVIQI